MGMVGAQGERSRSWAAFSVILGSGVVYIMADIVVQKQGSTGGGMDPDQERNLTVGAPKEAVEADASRWFDSRKNLDRLFFSGARWTPCNLACVWVWIMGTGTAEFRE